MAKLSDGEAKPYHKNDEIFGKGVELAQDLLHRYRDESDSNLIQSIISWSTIMQTSTETVRTTRSAYSSILKRFLSSFRSLC
mmetsp:Transcript_52378/g.157187  ORF Transcript_52378/g.157187 Transcript_52378/m.157187 type:complete len:82 (+) Transcript_52378:1596-1841(+)